MLANFRDYLKTLDVASNYYLGKMVNETEQSLGVYSQQGLRRVEAIGKDSSYDIAGFVLLLHWNKNANESETAARDLFEKIRYITDTDMGNTHVDYLDLLEAEPTFLGTDGNGVYEFSIAGRIYYRR